MPTHDTNPPRPQPGVTPNPADPAYRTRPEQNRRGMWYAVIGAIVVLLILYFVTMGTPVNETQTVPPGTAPPAQVSPPAQSTPIPGVTPATPTPPESTTPAPQGTAPAATQPSPTPAPTPAPTPTPAPAN